MVHEISMSTPPRQTFSRRSALATVLLPLPLVSTEQVSLNDVPLVGLFLLLGDGVGGVVD
jgi:hypothetical protein